MKKTTKLMTVLLATAMIAQTAPLSALGDAAAADEYAADLQTESVDTLEEDEEELPEVEFGDETVPETEEPEDTMPEDVFGDATTEEPEDTMPEDVFEDPETEAPTESATEAPAEPETEAETEFAGDPIYVTAMQWQDYLAGGRYTTLKDGMAVARNYIRVRFLLSTAPTAVEVTVNGSPADVEINRNMIMVTAELINGTHEMTITMHNGSTVTEDAVGFTVIGDEFYPTLNVTPSADLHIGQTKDFLVTGSNIGDISKLAMTISLTKQLRVEDVIIPDGLVGSFIWFRGELKLNLEITDPAAIQGDVLATIRVNAPTTITPGTELSWSVNAASFTLVDEPAFAYSEHLFPSFKPAEMTAVAEEYISIVGSGSPAIGMPYTLMVKNQLDEPIVGASVYVVVNELPELLGTTDENGMLTTDFFTSLGEYELFAVDVSGTTSSARFAVKVYEYVGLEDGTPYAIRFGTPVANGKTITWMSNYLTTMHSAQIRLSFSADMSNAVTLQGVSNLGQYGGSGLIVNRYNSVTLNNLVPGTVYYYQVGDGITWSEVRAFTAKAPDETVNIAVFGDVHDSANMELIANAIRDGEVDYDFGILTGSLVANGAQYADVADKVNAIGKLPAMDMIYVSNDAEKKSTAANALFNTGKEYETFVYGNVFVAVIHVTEDEATLASNLNKMVKDAQDSQTEWQILCLRQSPYSTDPSNAASLVAQHVPVKAEWAGIDLVLSSSDLHYARTDALKNGEITEENGVTYIICGSSDDKTAIADTEGYCVTSDAYNALYVSLEIQSDSMKITAYDVKADGSIEIVDEIIKTHFVCRDGEHVYRYGVSTEYIYCERCGAKTTVSRDFSGVLLIEGLWMYYENGGFSTGWKHNGRDVYYFSPSNYMGVNGSQLIDGYVYLFEDYVLVEGAWFEEDGIYKLMWAGEMLTNTWHTQSGKTYYFFEDGSCATGEVEITFTNENGESVTGTYLFGDDGVLIEQIA